MIFSAATMASAKDWVNTANVPHCREGRIVVHSCTDAVHFTSQETRTCSRLWSMSSARRSPPTQRVVTLLDYFAARPDERFGLSELAPAGEESKPTRPAT